MRRFAILPALAGGLLSAQVSAQETTALRAPPEFAIDQWTTEDGLPQNSVNAIVQAPDGYLWLGTFGGLARFDGTRFTLMERTDSAGRHIDRVLSLALGPDSTMWIGTESGLLSRRNGVYRAFTAAEGAPADEIRALYVDRAGVVWIGTAASGLAWLEHGRFGRLREIAGTEIGDVSSFVSGPGGTLWVNTVAGILTIRNGDAPSARWLESPDGGHAGMLLHDRRGARWLGLAGGTTRVSSGETRTYGMPGGSLMVEDPGGGYWVGTINDGAFFLDDDGDTIAIHRYALPDGRAGFRVRSAHVDADGSVWLGTNANGLLRARRNLFTTYTSAHGLSHDVATAVFGDRSGNMWIATNCGGVNAIDAAQRTVRVLNPRSPGDPEGDPCAFALAQAPDGSMWQGSYGGGVSMLSAVAGSARVRVTGLRDSVVLALLTTRSGTMWAGTRAGGLAAIENRSVRATYTTADGLAHNSIRTVYETRDGTIWVGTIGGLSRLDGDRFTTFTAADGLSSAHVRAIHEDAAGTLWIGTYGGGLNRFRDGRFAAITRQDGLGDDFVSAILEDDAGNFWMSGNRGIYRVSRAQAGAFADGRIDQVHSVLYGRADGLRTPETNGGFQPAGWKDQRGHLWFPTVEGVAVVDPARVVRSSRAPSVALEEVIVDGESRDPADVVVVGPGRPNLEFRYTSLSLSAPEHVRFRYRLEGFDDEWVDAGSRRVAYYPRLTAGTYRFAVRAANRDGAWGEAGSLLELRVVPSFWSAWWFRLAATLALLGLGVALVRRRELLAREDRRAKEEFSRRLIESQEHERKRLARELHDGLGQELLIVRNRALLALRMPDVDPGIRDQLSHITEMVGDSLGSIRELAHNLSPHQLEHLGISSALRTMIEAVAQTSAIDLTSGVEEIDGLLPIESEINLYRIVQEALNNVVRHSGATSAAVRVRHEGFLVRVTIADEGRGFEIRRDSRGHALGGFGLSGMAERARILGGVLEVRSAPGHGARVELYLPVASASAPAAVESDRVHA